MRLEQAFRLSKEPDYPEANEDVFAFDAQGAAAALSDGASESFDSQSWGRLLCESFITRRQRLSVDPPETFAQSLLADSRAAFNQQIASRQLSWSQQAALSRGNFASLIGVADGADEILLLAIGDSIALWQDAQGAIQTWILKTPEEFQRNPVLLGSDPRSDLVLLNRERSRWGLCRVKKSNILHGRLWLMTDAIAAWVMRLTQSQQTAEVTELLQSNTGTLEAWVRQKRYHKELRIDDTTLLTLTV